MQNRRRYHYENGLLRRAYSQDHYQQDGFYDAIPLAVVTNPSELRDVDQLYRTSVDPSVSAVPDELAKVIDRMAVESDETLQHLSELFGKYEIPIGVLSKLMSLREYHVWFILDDSGSMGTLSDSDHWDSSFMRTKYPNKLSKFSPATRWLELQDRIHLIMEFMVYVKPLKITIEFLNRGNPFTYSYNGEDPREVLATIQGYLDKSFTSYPNGSTPIYGAVNKALRTTEATMVYLFTDGQPTDCGIKELKKMFRNRVDPQLHPVTFVSCTSDDGDVEWMKQVDEEAPWTAEVDDYITEKEEVINKQGKVFPYTIGMWLMCLLCAAINPKDLDALDESTPLTQEALGKLLGRKLTPQEYDLYMKGHCSRRGVCSIC